MMDKVKLASELLKLAKSLSREDMTAADSDVNDPKQIEKGRKRLEDDVDKFVNKHKDESAHNLDTMLSRKYGDVPNDIREKYYRKHKVASELVRLAKEVTSGGFGDAMFGEGHEVKALQKRVAVLEE